MPVELSGTGSRRMLACLVIAFVFAGTAALLQGQTPAPAPLPAPAAGAPAAPTPAEGEGAKTQSLLEMFSHGGWIGVVLVIFSLINVTLIVEFFLNVRECRLLPTPLLQRLDELIKEKRMKEAYQVAGGQSSEFARLMASLLLRCQRGHDRLLEVLDREVEGIATRLNRRPTYFAMMAAAAPLMGLFGTVSGMINEFRVIAASDIAPKPSQMAAGISEALVATYLGLVVAIPAAIAYTFARNRVYHLVQRLTYQAEMQLEHFPVPAAATASIHPGTASPPGAPSRPAAPKNPGVSPGGVDTTFLPQG